MRAWLAPLARWRANANERDAAAFMLAAFSATMSGDGDAAAELQEMARLALKRRDWWERLA